MRGVELVRLETVHPALIHFTIGLVPLIVLAYAVAARRRSEAWTFVGDVATFLGAGVTVVAAVFGLVSNAVVPWPGGLETWRWLHLGGGLLATAVFAALAVGRLRARRRAPGPSGRAALAGSLGLAALVAATGWIGGEVLVFHAGVAVKAAAQGALAPPTGRRERRPRDFTDAMGALRGAWAAASTRVAATIVERPTPADFQAVAEAADRIASLASGLARPAAPPEGPGAANGDDHGHDHGGDDARHAVEMLRSLASEAEALGRAARAADVSATARALGAIGESCAHCHAELRWRAPAGVSLGR